MKNLTLIIFLVLLASCTKVNEIHCNDPANPYWCANSGKCCAMPYHSSNGLCWQNLAGCNSSGYSCETCILESGNGNGGITDVSGNWHGTNWHTTPPGANWVLTLTQSGTSLTGSVSCYAGGGGAGPYSLSGTINGNHLSLSYGVSGCQVNLDATVSNNTLTGTYIGSGGACGCFALDGSWTGTRP